ncbi:Protein of unknown function [Amycolatopsis arida]|uniref:Uncharacterized protein n=1 Tax=Amycolatopsis arida TaxID=587909 RepID=A0A1I5TCE2_9PSEU|nr:DUF3311 domain-containing protein [Amycolatopsis arida]TDX96145.1 uncharacterized protein DUF3311 [Amycolatopsis arida]SFP80724.1 Protein of unknown function [Amycolatopsis arida]
MSAGKADRRVSGLVLSPWNLLLILPFWILLTPLYNRVDPVLFGMPFFYWFQFVGIAVGVVCTATVYRMTRRKPSVPARGAPRDVDELDEGSDR